MANSTQLQPIENVDAYKRDMASSAIVSVDNNALIAYKARKANSTKINNDINVLKKDMSQIRKMLDTIMEKIDG